MSYSSFPSPATKSGRPLKPDAIPGAIVDYLNAYRLMSQVLPRQPRIQHHQQQLLTPSMMPSSGLQYELGFRGQGGSGQKNNSGNCGQHSLWWWGNEILDIGTPQGDRNGSEVGAPAPLTNMFNIYPKYNIIFDRGTCYYVPAQNGIAQGERKTVPCTTFNHFGFGFGTGTPVPNSQISLENMQRKLDYRRLWQVTNWATNALDYLLEGYTPQGFARGGGGGGGGSNYGGQRMIQATIAGKSIRVALDSGTDVIMGAGNGNKQCAFDPNPQTINVPSVSHAQASYYYVPAWYISQRIKVCLTNEYTICQSYGSGDTISYNVNSGQKQTGDALNGRAWGEGGSNTSTTSGSNTLQPKPQPQQHGHSGGYYYQY